MTKPMRATEAYASLHSKLVRGVRSTPEPQNDDETFLMVAGTQSSVMGVLGLSDEQLFPYLGDLRHIARAINRRITGMED